MGYQGKLAERQQARQLRRAGLPLAEIDRLLAEGRARIGRLSEREFLVAGVALYAGEGSKQDGRVRFVNSDPRMVVFFCSWLRHFYEVDESRLRLVLYLHQGLDLSAAIAYWSADRYSRVSVHEAVPGCTRPVDPPRQACAWLRNGRLQLQRDPPQYHGARQRAPQ
jgi:hypothetical protein